MSQERKVDGFAHPSSVRPGPEKKVTATKAPEHPTSPAQRVAEGHPVQGWQRQQLCQTEPAVPQSWQALFPRGEGMRSH